MNTDLKGIQLDVATPKIPAQRLCNEIQLFDLCELDSCKFKKDRFCTNEELIEKFESIEETEEKPTPSSSDNETDGEWIDDEDEYRYEIDDIREEFDEDEDYLDDDEL